VFAEDHSYPSTVPVPCSCAFRIHIRGFLTIFAVWFSLQVLGEDWLFLLLPVTAGRGKDMPCSRDTRPSPEHGHAEHRATTGHPRSWKSEKVKVTGGKPATAESQRGLLSLAWGQGVAWPHGSGSPSLEVSEPAVPCPCARPSDRHRRQASLPGYFGDLPAPPIHLVLKGRNLWVPYPPQPLTVMLCHQHLGVPAGDPQHGHCTPAPRPRRAGAVLQLRGLEWLLLTREPPER